MGNTVTGRNAELSKDIVTIIKGEVCQHYR